MKLYHKLNLALERGGLPSLKRKNAYRKIGAGAWHDAYLVYPRTGDRLVIRLRKPVIYGRTETFDERYLREDYEPVGVYYRQANQCWPGICPTVYTYLLEPDLTGTIESYMGRGMAIAGLRPRQAVAFGQRLGQFFRAMHTLLPPLGGFGMPIWNGDALAAPDQRPLPEIWQAEVDTLWDHFDRLCQTKLPFDRAGVKQKLEEVLASRSFEAEPVVLVNRDITPENLIVRRHKFIGLVDPVPLLHNGLRYASFFVYCYKSYLPNFSDAPRYAHHQFQRYRPILNALAEGYLEGYSQGEATVRQNLHLEYFLWAVNVAYENLHRLINELTDEIRLRAGDKQAIAARLQRCLRELEDYQLDNQQTKVG